MISAKPIEFAFLCGCVPCGAFNFAPSSA